MDLPPNDFNFEIIQQQFELEESLLQQQQQLLEQIQTSHGQSRSKRSYIYRDHGTAHQRLLSDYFTKSPTYTDPQFRRRYHMQRPLFLRIVDSLSNYDVYFNQRRNNVGTLGLSPLQKCTAALRMLAYGVVAYACDEYVKIGESTAVQCVQKFCEGIIDIFEKDYLRRPNEEGLQRLLQVGQERGYPGMVGSIDYHQSFDDIENGEAPEMRFTVNGHQYNHAYYLADGIYPKWPVFVQSIQEPQGEKTKLFAKLQESCRKDVERAFGVLQARFSIIRQLARMWGLKDLSKIMRTCVTLHNMIVEDERNTYHRNWENMENNASSSSKSRPRIHPQFEVHVQGRSESDIHTRPELRDRAKHLQLKADLVEHIWQKFDGNDI